MNIPHYRISYAQNYEDLILAGILREVSDGFYVDVGANDPTLDSVTKLFYDRNWSGINVEPNQKLIENLRQARPRDINLDIGLSSQAGQLKFRSYTNIDGLSSFSQNAQDLTRSAHTNLAYEDSFVIVDSLANVLEQHRPTGHIHFLKIDVEGLELEVLLGNNWKKFRPWTMCIERTNDQHISATILAFLNGVQYQEVFFDGINDYFIAKEQMHIWEAFSYARDVLLNGVRLNYIFSNCIEELAQRVRNFK
jgi:FkbM family methyltransferase